MKSYLTAKKSRAHQSYITIFLIAVVAFLAGCNVKSRKEDNKETTNNLCEQEVENAANKFSAYPLILNPLTPHLTYDYQKIIRSNPNKLIACKVFLHDIEQIDESYYGIFYDDAFAGGSSVEFKVKLTIELLNELEKRLLKEDTDKMFFQTKEFIGIFKINGGYKKETQDIAVNDNELSESRKFVFEGELASVLFDENKTTKK